MTSTGQRPAQTADGKWEEQVGAHTDWEAGEPQVLQHCSGFGSVVTSACLG